MPLFTCLEEIGSVSVNKSTFSEIGYSSRQCVRSHQCFRSETDLRLNMSIAVKA
jgi:hypothetical protein